MQLGQLRFTIPSALLSAGSEAVISGGIRCRTVSSRGDLASCPEGECKLLLRLSGHPPRLLCFLVSVLDIYFLRTLSHPPVFLLPAQLQVSISPPTQSFYLLLPGQQPPASSAPPPCPLLQFPSFSGASLLAGLAVTSCSCGSACGSWDVREGTTCHCQCAGIDWTAARCCALGVGA